MLIFVLADFAANLRITFVCRGLYQIIIIRFAALSFCAINTSMPLSNIIHNDAGTKLLVWDIRESLADLFDCAALTDRSIFRIGSMKSRQHQKGFIAVRLLLQHAGYTDAQLVYDGFGKPHLPDGKYISISHSHDCSAIGISDRPIGIDLELQRDKIVRIASKFMEPSMLLDPTADDYVRKLTVNWGIKECIFKIRNEKGISFKDHISAKPFDLADKKTTAELHFGSIVRNFDVHFEELGTYTLVFAFENDFLGYNLQ